MDEIPLPGNLDVLPTYATSREVHLHGTHRIDLTKTSVINFTISEESYFRAYLGGDTFDVDLWLYRNNVWFDMSIAPYRDDMITNVLTPASYRLEIKSIGWGLTDNDKDPLKCHTILFELAISPVKLTHARQAAYTYCPGEQLVPEIRFEALDNSKPVIFDSDLDQNNARQYNLLYNPAANRSTSHPYNPTTNYIHHYDFTLSPKPGTNPTYRFRASIGYDFLSGGFVKIILAPSKNGTLPTCQWYTSDCILGKNLVSNKHTVSTTLGPGSYSLWLVDNVAERYSNITTCTPFSIDLEIVQNNLVENYVSCHAERIPTNLNLPGFIDDTGFVHFKKDVFIDLSQREHETQFTLRTRSLFRVYVEAHRVDIDLTLKSDAGTLARTFKGATQDESIVYVLEPNTPYTVVFTYYTTLDADFCETFLLEFQIEPLISPYTVDYCTGHETTVPTVSFDSTFRLPKTTYNHVFSSDSHVETFFTWKIVPTAIRQIAVRVESPFLSGLVLTLKNNASFVTKNAVTVSPHGGVLSLMGFLATGMEYTVELKAGPWQAMYPTLTPFPSCTPYDLQVSFDLPFAPIPSIFGVCNNFLPSELNGTAYLGTSNRIHLQGDFVVPHKDSGFELTQLIPFTVRTRSMFRAFTRNVGLVEVSFSLTEDSVNVPHEYTGDGIEKLSSILSVGKQYVFKVTYYADFAVLPPCTTWNLELEIAPIPTDMISQSCTQEKLPFNIYYIAPSTVYESSDEYSFTQSIAPFTHSISFRVTEYVYFRSAITFDFVWSDLTLKLISNDTVVALGFNNDNQNYISGVQLEPGDYSLQIFEPSAQEMEELRRCTEFTFLLAIAPVHSTSKIVATDYTGCTDFYFPKTFDSVAYLSDISGQMMHFQRDNLIDVKKRVQTTKFSVTVPSHIRIIVPPHQVDIDVVLSRIVDGTETTIDSSLGYEEESIFQTLEPGDYSLVFRFLPNYKNGFYFPEAGDCVTFDVEIAIAPVEYAVNSLTTPAPCVSNSVPPLEFSQLRDVIFNRPTTPFQLNIPFSLTTAALFQLQVSYVFLPAPLFVTLKGSNILSPFVSAPTNRSWIAYQSKDFTFFDHVIYPGSYQLTIEDFDNFTHPDRCSSLVVEYLIDVGNVPPNYCDDADKLPSDLFSDKGGSIPYGGLQDPDGSVRISGTHFLIPGKQTHTNLLFNITQPSWVRYWIGVQDEHTDIDFLLWKDVGKTVLLEASVGLTKIESHLTFLQPQSQAYLLDIFIFDRSTSDCSYASFEMAIEPNATAHSRLICPSPLPNPAVPPNRVELSDSVNIYSEFLFTNEFVSSHLVNHWTYKTVTYDISLLAIDQKFDLLAIVGYDFTLTDFSLTLLGPDGTVLTTSQGGVTETNTDGFVDFQASLSWKISPGNHTLRITEKIYNNRPMNAGECHQFSFMLSAVGLGVVSQPHVSHVLPPAGSQLDASFPLMIDVHLSEPVHNSISGANLLELSSFIRSHNVARLVKSDNSLSLYPSNAYFWNPTVLTVFFNNLRYDSRYVLSINATALVNVNNTQFLPYTESHTYNTMSCQCSGHGACAPNATHFRECVCRYPYAGVECKSCEVGYHREGVSCVENIHCMENTCNHHGICSDSLGYPVCACTVGFENNGSSLCSRCQVGYSNYPICTPNIDDRITSCTAPLVPNDLNTVAYLDSLSSPDSVHLQSSYYLDLSHTTQTLKFKLRKDSYVRIYTEPHAVDIDIWVWKEEANGDITVIDKGIRFNEEESIFAKMDAGGSYSIQFQFITFGIDEKTLGSCPVFGMELAIEPVTQVQAETTQYNCQSSIQFPQITLGQIPTTGYKFDQPNTIFHTSLTSGTLSAIEFSVTKQSGKVLLLKSEVNYRFLPGQIALKLQRTDNNVTQYFQGFSLLNSYHVQHLLYEGSYRLIIYLTEPLRSEISSCVPFTFNLEASFLLEEQNIFNCPHPPLPASLSTPAFQGNNLQLYGEFLIEHSSHQIDFSVTVPSTIRISFSSNSVFQSHLKVYNGTTNKFDTIAHNENRGDLLYNYLVSQYKYQIEITYTAIEVVACPKVELELAILPNIEFLGMQSLYGCPGGRVPVLPALPSVISSPYFFENPKINVSGVVRESYFYTFNDYGETVATFNFLLDKNSLVEFGIATHFITGNLQLTLLLGSGQLVHSQSAQEHYNYIRQELNQGTYTLTITQTRTPAGLSSLIPCIPFTFTINATALDVAKSIPCYKVVPPLVPLPDTLDSLRYLSIDNVLQIQNQHWQVPAITWGMASKRIPFTVREKSIIRVYVSQNIVDIDVRVESNGRRVASGSNLYAEESFITELSTGTYTLVFQFYNWGADIPACPGFNMELAIVPVSKLPSIKQFCPDNMKQNWPVLPSSLGKSDFPYESQFSANLFNYQQIDHNMYSIPLKTYTISLMVSADLHIEVGYNFVLGDLLLKLTSNSISPIYGLNEYYRNVINIKNLPPGYYNLTIHEPTANHPSVIGCNYFTFYFFADVPSGVDKHVEDPIIRLPTDLSTIQYLHYRDSVHFQGDYVVLEDVETNPTAKMQFTLTKTSLVKTTVGMLTAFDMNIKSDSIRVHPALMQVVKPGDYSLNFYLRDGKTSGQVSSDLEMTVFPLDTLASAITANIKCPTSEWVPPTISIPPNGFYQFRDKHAFLSERQLKLWDHIYVIPFVLKIDSSVSVLVQYDFVLSDLLILIRNNNTYLVDPTRYGTNSYNMDDLKVFLPKGAYELVISQTNPWSVPRNTTELPRLPCVEFDIQIIIADTKSRVRPCTDFLQFPWDFNTEYGGSQNIGGPIRDHAISMFYDSFLLPSHLSSLSGRVRVDTPSIIAVFIGQNGFNQFDSVLVDASSVNTVIPHLGKQKTWQEAYSIYRIEDATDYNIKIDYIPSTWEECTTFSFGLAMKPITTVAQYLQTQCGTAQQKFPTSLNFGVSVVSSYFTESDLASHTQDNLFKLVLPFVTTKDANVVISLSYYSLSSMFSLSLLQKYDFPDGQGNNFTYGQVAFSSWAMENSNFDTATQVLDTSLWPGEYRLEITQPLLPKPNAQLPACFPFTFSSQILDDSTESYVRNVEPSSGVDLNPQLDFYIKLKFSEAVHNSNDEILMRGESSEYLLSALYLEKPKSTARIYPKQVLTPSVIPSPDDYTSWVFVFDHTSFEFGATYSLHLEDNYIFGSKGDSFTMPYEHTYTMVAFDETCSGFGTYDKTLKVCTCTPESHRTGPQCEKCENGYDLDRTNVCVGAESCHIDTCGCLSRKTVTDPCDPIGKCKVDPNKPLESRVECECPVRYSGPRCNQCAIGYSNYPVCSKTCNPPCVGGLCDQDTLQCKCFTGWSGPNCATFESLGTLKAIVGTLVFIVIAGIAGSLIYWYWKKRGTTSSAFGTIDHGLELELEGRKIGGGEDSEIGLDEDSEGERVEVPLHASDGSDQD
eukprot:TRINITY_DN7777_c0_g2_i1.p1 TRINITY_DN7777_c0_g2~~TRINITY_DN7777_c0_g2_i1.p1  ORF type:complete len:3439 (+),score=468.43 TRINITY_DN7777_c0_g2_i1:104-10318(+)